MFRFLTGRFISTLISIVGATAAIFLLVHVSPTDPREQFVPQSGYGLTRESWERLGDRLGFNKPAIVQYFEWLGRVARLDFGVSLGLQISVWDIMKGKLGATLQLGVGGWLGAVLLGVPAGVVAAVRRGGFFDYIARFAALVGQAAPPFLTAMVMILIFSNILGWLPAGRRTADEFIPTEYLLPCAALAVTSAAGLMRLTRSSMLEVLDSEYVKMARAKGVNEWTVLFKHSLRNALVVPITSMLLLFAGFLNGALVIEIVFGWPGIGQVALQDAVQNNDFPLLLGSVIVFLVYYLVFSTLADILYTIIDPRVRLG